MRQAQALAVMLGGKPVFLTGAPGAGKTFVLNEFVCRARRRGKNVAVTASTGIAATHIGGVTIHSWSGLGIKEAIDERTKQQLANNARLSKRYNAADILIIDEISMLHGHRLNMVNEVCKLLRGNSKPFGGLQVILVGDLFQLPPVSKNSDELDFAHLSAAWQELQPQVCYLSEQHRQVGDGLLDLLEAMRRGEIEDYHQDLLRERMESRADNALAITRLFAHNVDIDTVNQRHLSSLNDEPHSYEMVASGNATKVEQLKRSVLAPEILELKTDAEVMFVANNQSAGFYNGTRGRVVEFKEGKPVVELANGRKLTVAQHSWQLEEDGKVRAEVSQLPLRLAWAITIHKSQGMSLDAAEIDLSKTFTPGMGYVALSRVRSLSGLYLSGINRMALAMHPQIFEFDIELRNASAELATVTANAEDESQEEVAELGTDLAVNQELLRALKNWRMVRAKAGSVPAYVIAHDSVLEQVAKSLPASPQALLSLKGFGPSKIESYGDDILELVQSHSPEESNVEAEPDKWSAKEDKLLLDSFRGGLPLAELCELLQRPASEVWGRLQKLSLK